MSSQNSGMASGDVEKQSSESSAQAHSSGQDASTPDVTAPAPRRWKNPFHTPTSRTPDNRTPAVSAPPSAKTSGPNSVTDPRSDSRASGMEVKPRNERYFKSRRIKKGTTERPWLTEKDPRAKWNTIIPLIGLFIGIGVCAFLIYDGIKSVTNNKYCSVFEDDFSSGFNNRKWMKEVEVGGFG
jgi:hypothetical protein